MHFVTMASHGHFHDFEPDAVLEIVVLLEVARGRMLFDGIIEPQLDRRETPI